MSFMAYSLQPTVAVDISYRSGNAPLDQTLRRRPYPATAGSRGRLCCFALRIHR
jgi:hypothetical protein